MEPGTPASWQADPTGRHEHRYWDGERWTDSVSDRGASSTDPYVRPPAVAPSAAPAVDVPSAPGRSTSTNPIVDAKPPSRGTVSGPTIVVALLTTSAIVVVIALLTNL